MPTDVWYAARHAQTGELFDHAVEKCTRRGEVVKLRKISTTATDRPALVHVIAEHAAKLREAHAPGRIIAQCFPTAHKVIALCNGVSYCGLHGKFTQTAVSS